MGDYNLNPAYFKKAARLLVKVRAYVQTRKDTAEGQHGNWEGLYYLNGGKYKTMQEAQELLDEIDNLGVYKEIL